MTPAELLYHEAALLDERRFDEWLALFTDDALYWVPQGEDGDPARRSRSPTTTGAGCTSACCG